MSDRKNYKVTPLFDQPEKLICPYCSKEYAKPWTLSKHMIEHQQKLVDDFND